MELTPERIDIIIIGLALACVLIGLSVHDEWKRDIKPKLRRLWRDRPMATKLDEYNQTVDRR